MSMFIYIYINKHVYIHIYMCIYIIMYEYIVHSNSLFYLFQGLPHLILFRCKALARARASQCDFQDNLETLKLSADTQAVLWGFPNSWMVYNGTSY